MVTGSGRGGIRGGSESNWFPDPSLSSNPGGVVWAESSSESSSSMGAAVGFSFRSADGSAVTNRGSLEAGGAFLGAGSAGSGGDVAHLSLRSARNNMGTRGTPE